MTERQRRRGRRKRRRRQKRLIRRIQAWAARFLVLSVLILFCAGILRMGIWLLEHHAAVEETFEGARSIEPVERKPGSRLIVLDAGHGGRDQGTSAGEILEKEINLSVVKKLAEELEDAGATVILTREEDVKIGLEERAAFANQNEADIFISLHCNYCEDDAGVQGLECYYREGSDDGRILAEQIVQSVETEDGIKNRGTRTADFRVLRRTDMPAVLIEMGYLSNKTERERMADETYQKLLAEKIAEGILKQETSETE